MSDFPYTKEQLAWLEALESGKYKQGHMRLLNDNGGFCCLGVACDLAGIVPERSKGKYFFEDMWEAAPDSVRKRLLLRDNEGKPKSFGGAYLSGLNDIGKTFAEIAAIIRSDPSEYFTNLDGEQADV